MIDGVDIVTQDALNRANEIMDKIKGLEESLGFLQCKVYTRERDIKEYKENKKRWIPFDKWFCVGKIKENGKVTLDAPIECRPSLEFELDKECVDFIIKHQREKINELRKELEEL